MAKKYDREQLDALLDAAIESQHQYWDALRDLELALGCEIEGDDIVLRDLDGLIALAGGTDSGDDNSDGEDSSPSVPAH
jgi:hypothetical protein